MELESLLRFQFWSRAAVSGFVALVALSLLSFFTRTVVNGSSTPEVEKEEPKVA